MITKLNLPRFVEVILGVLLVILLIGRHSSGPHAELKYLLQYIIPYKPFFILVKIFLYLVAARLIAGKPKDYTQFFYNMLVKLNGKPKNH